MQSRGGREAQLQGTAGASHGEGPQGSRVPPPGPAVRRRPRDSRALSLRPHTLPFSLRHCSERNTGAHLTFCSEIVNPRGDTAVFLEPRQTRSGAFRRGQKVGLGKADSGGPVGPCPGTATVPAHPAPGRSLSSSRPRLAFLTSTCLGTSGLKTTLHSSKSRSIRTAGVHVGCI